MDGSSPHYVDIVFPVSLGALTYRCPESLAGSARPGMAVSAPLRGRPANGIITAVDCPAPTGGIREVIAIHGEAPVLSRKLLRLLEWMADYYLAPLGSVLRQAVPKELFSEMRPRRKRKERLSKGHCFNPVQVSSQDVAPLARAASTRTYQAFLTHAPSAAYEFSLILSLLDAGVGRTLIILPEISGATLLYRTIKERYGERVCLLHGGVPEGRRSECLRGILSGRHDIVVGTRLALFAPVRDLSAVFLLQEHSGSYKLEEGVRFSTRDAAVMRGYMEKCTVLLSSVTPSVDSYFNALSGKYVLVRPSPGAKARVRILDLRSSRMVKPGISKVLCDASRSSLRAGKKVIFLINRRGYSTLLHCRECGHSEVCPHCQVPLVMHGEDKTLRCHYCGLSKNVPEFCGRCRSTDLELLGMGTQRLQQEIQDLLGITAVRFDSDSVCRTSKLTGILEDIAAGESRVVVGTKMMTGKIGSPEGISLAAVLNVDAQLNFPDFRAPEKVFAELSALRELVDQSGQMLIQTRFPDTPVFRHIRSGDYAAFVCEELALRKALNYPPYCKLLNLRFRGESRSLDSRLSGLAKRLAGADIEILGPTAVKGRKGREDLSMLLKSSARKPLKDAARIILREFGKLKGVEIIVDVDPR